jgi:hypothetical protein
VGEVMFCLNLCEILSDSLWEHITVEDFFDLVSKKHGTIERVYIGSYFCSQFFLRLSGYKRLFHYCKEKNIPITIVIPVFSQKDIAFGKNKIDSICTDSQGLIDEITVNDVGMLSWCQEKQKYGINLGRLFFKDSRDCRVPEYKHLEVEPYLVSNLNEKFWSRFRINVIEVDPTNQKLIFSRLNKTNMTVGIHYPLCYMTTGNICKFASIHRTPQQKFRPNIKCDLECLHIIDYYSGYVHQTKSNPLMLRIGRTLYYETGKIELMGIDSCREIYFPLLDYKADSINYS